MVRDVRIKNSNHERIVRLFFEYLASVAGSKRLLPDLLSQLLDIDLADTEVSTGCFNDIFDGTEPPYEDVDFYIRCENDMRIFVYGSVPDKEKELKHNEYVLIVLFDNLKGNIERKANRHIYIT